MSNTGSSAEKRRGVLTGSGRIVNWETAPRIAARWREGATLDMIDQEFGGQHCLNRARRLLGVAAVPFRKLAAAATDSGRLVTSRDLGRHLVRKLSDGQFIVRDEHFREELWRTDPHGVRFRFRLRLTFVTVMGMTERRVPEDLRHIYTT